MTDKEFRRLSKSDLLDIIFELQKNEEHLKFQIEQLKETLESKERRIQHAESIAEAALSVSGAAEALQSAADQYIAKAQTVEDEACKKIEGFISELRCETEKILNERRAVNKTRESHSIADMIVPHKHQRDNSSVKKKATIK